MFIHIKNVKNWGNVLSDCDGPQTLVSVVSYPNGLIIDCNQTATEIFNSTNRTWCHCLQNFQPWSKVL